jgi:molybdate transport system ATP-binding protein
MNEALIELRRVAVALNGKTILRGLSWRLRAGEHWAVRGGNGSGKSTFLRLLRGEVWPAPGCGERIFRLHGQAQVTAVGVKEVVALVSPELQERYLRHEWRLTVRDVIHTGFAQSDLLYAKLAPGQKAEAEAAAERLHIAPLLRRDVQTLSTGELRKVLIARALVGHPKILLLDEVCDGLDAAFRREMLGYIDAIARAGTQIVYTTHRADEALPSITHEIVFEAGRIVRAGAAEKVASQDVPPPSRRVSAKAAAPARHSESTTLIDIRRANVFLERKKILHGLAWQLRAGEHWAVLGGNGAGKTTFLKLVSGQIWPAVGARIERFGLTARDTIWDLRRRIGCVSPLLQTHYCEPLNAEQVVASGFFSSVGLMDEVTPAQWSRVRKLFAGFGIGALRAKQFEQLSFGERRKVLTLRALVHEPRLLVFDEPFDGLDSRARRDFARALEKIAAHGTQLLIVTHHLNDLPRCVTHGIFLEAGRVAVSGEWPAVRRHPQVTALFGA